MKQKMKKLMGIMLCLVMVLGMMAGTSTTALAYDRNPYASLVNTTTLVTFNGKRWYIIEDNSTAKDAGTVTLLAADTSFGLSKFSDSSNNYSSSTVKSVLDAYTAPGGKFETVADAIETNTDAGGKLYLLSLEETKGLSKDVLKSKFHGNDCAGSQWWLRSPGNGDDSYVAFVNGEFGVASAHGNYFGWRFGVRPALKLNLSSVIFKSGTHSCSFELKPSQTNTPSPEDIAGQLPQEITLNDEAAVNTAVEAYLALTEGQKELFSPELKQRLADAEDVIITGKAAATTTKVSGAKNLKGGKVRMQLGNPHYYAVKGKAASVLSAQEDITISGFYIQYSTDKKFNKGVKSKKIKDPAARIATIKHLKKGKTYYFRTCTYTEVKNRVSGEEKTVKGKWSAKKKVKINK